MNLYLLRVKGSLFFLILVFFQINHKIVYAQEEKPFPPYFELKLDQNGKVPILFWSYDPSILVVQKPISIFNTSFDLIRQKPPFPGDDFEEELNETLKTKVDELIRDLKKQGFDFSNLSGSGGCYGSDSISGQSLLEHRVANAWSLEKEMDRSSYFLFELWGCHVCWDFLIDKEKPFKLIFVQELENKPPYKGLAIQKSNDGLSFLDSVCAGPVGREGIEHQLIVMDFNFRKATIKNYSWANGENFGYFEKLSGDGSYSLVLIPQIVDECVGFTYIYDWIGDKWKNNNLKYWHLFKTQKMGGVEIGSCGKNRAQVLEALKTSFENDDVLTYWKEKNK